jgi:hypothetical protein
MGRIICVHGIGDHQPDFWKPWAAAIQAVIGEGDTYDGAWWEGALDGGQRSAGRARPLVREVDQSRGGPTPEERLRNQINALIRLNERRIVQDDAGARAMVAPRGGIWDYVGDFVRYMLEADVRARVQEAVRRVLLAGASSEVSIVAHSWGTVVAYDVLHQLARQRPAFACANFITLGSPLWMEPVRAILADQGQHHVPGNTARWINAYNTFDPVGPSVAGGLDSFYARSLARDERVSLLALNPHEILKYLANGEVDELLREAFRGVGVRTLVKAPHVSKKAVVVGINNYGVRAPKLNGCVNDALQMGEVLRRYFGFENANIRVLTDERATQQAILERLEWLVADARDGDELVFHFSGHGSQVADRDGDEVDNLDEIICPYDMDWDNPFSDDLFGRYFDRLSPRVNLTVVLDCCHSGTGLRDVRPNSLDRFLLPPPDIRNRVAEAVDDLGPYFSATLIDPSLAAAPPSARGDRALRVLPRPILRGPGRAYAPVLIAGCKSTETSADVMIDHDYHGALTHALVQSVQRVRGRITYRALIQEIRRLMPTYGTRQTPQLEGPGARLGRLFITQATPGETTRPRKPATRRAARARRRGRRARAAR